MPSHFSTIGMPIKTQKELAELVERVSEKCASLEVDSGRYLRWSDPSGAELWIQVDADNNFVGLNPHFSGKGSLRVALTERIQRPESTEMEGAFHGWAVDPTDDSPEHGYYPFVFDCPDFRRHESLALPAARNVQIAAFTHELSLYDTPEAFAAAQTGIKYAAQAFIPSGLFALDGKEDDVPRPYAIFTGIILEAEEHRNELTGKRFQWLLVDSLGGRFDVVADPELVTSEIRIGGVVYGSFWMTGKIGERGE